VGFGDRGGQRPCSTTRSPRNSCSEAAAFAVWVAVPSCWNQQSVTCQHCPTLHMFLIAECCLIRYFFVRIRSDINASRTAANDFSAKWCSRVNTRSSRAYTLFVPAQLLRNWHEQRPSNQGYLDSSVTGKVGRVYYTGVDLILISFSYRSTWLFLLDWVLNGTPRIMQRDEINSELTKNNILCNR
jgi:hypothetical protein